MKVSSFENETAITANDSGWACRVEPHWSIGGTPNGGYALSPLLRALGSLAGLNDPLSVTAHFLRPATPACAGQITGRSIRSGRTLATAAASLHQEGTERIFAVAAFGDLGGASAATALDLDIVAPDIASPERCVGSGALEEGVEISISSRLEVRLDPGCATPGASDRASLDGWVRFADGAPPAVLALPLFADAFPPSLYPRFGRFGWVPTVELTVHVRRRPAPGWIQGRFECDDLVGGRMIETGTLWDEDGRVVARSRQLGLVRSV